MKQKLTTLTLILLIIATLTQSVLAADLSHGTADHEITEDMLVNTPPSGYKIKQSTQADAKDGAYNAYFLEDEIQTVSIEIHENNLNYLLQNAAVEPYVLAESVTVGDTTVSYCGLKTKGAYTLAHAVTDNEGSDRFSFTVNFGKYINKEAGYGERQDFYGCDKISFNNFFFDKSMMKEFFSLKLMDEMGLPTPQYGLAKLYINGDYYGVYAMVEAMDESILEQYYGVTGSELSGYLTKPEGTLFHYDALVSDPAPLYERDEQTRLEVEPMLPTVMEWIRKLNCLSSGTDFDGNAIDVNSEDYLTLLGQVLDVDEVVKYFAVHSWLCQMDNMFVGQKNFGLYIRQDGTAVLIPWDYDLSFGCYYPSTAQATANYNIDVMFKIDPDITGDTSAATARVYANYPLFNVIYQNEALMEQYHGYMKECSRVAALGGTVESTGKCYDPGFFHSFIARMEETVIEAASEDLADNVYYMNHIRQPSDVKNALPNLSKIIALRSVGVYAQVEGLQTTVSASGCDLETLGNGSGGWSANSGHLTIVDAATGIFASAEFAGGGDNDRGGWGRRRSAAPSLTAAVLQEGDALYASVQESAGEADALLVYELSNTVKAESGYAVTIPMAAEYMAEGAQRKFYAFADGVLTELAVTVDDNLFTMELENLGTIAVVVTGLPEKSGGVPAAAIGIALAAAVIAALSVILISRKKAGKKAN